MGIQIDLVSAVSNQLLSLIKAILVEAAAEVPAAGDSYRGVWVFAEQRNGKLKSVAYELLSRGRQLADTLGTELCVICFGHGINEAQQLIAYGADKVYLMDAHTSSYLRLS